MANTDPIRFLILSDTHDLTPATASPSLLRSPLPTVDIVLHSGDLTQAGGVENHIRARSWLAAIDAELKLVIAGNHDIDLDADFWRSRDGSAHDHEAALRVWTGTEASSKGVHLLTEGTHRFTLMSGASFTIYVSPRTPEYGVSAFQYPSNHDIFNSRETPSWAVSAATEASVIPLDVDIVMTHGPPKYILDSTADGSNAGCEHLRRAVERVKPRLHCFGHIHAAWGAKRMVFEDDEGVLMPPEFVGRNQVRRRGHAEVDLTGVEKGEQTLFVNAAIGHEDGEAGNAAWVVTLDLPVII